MCDLEQDPDFQSLLKSVSHPALEMIAALARKRGIKQAAEFWDLFDFVGSKWRERKSCAV